MEQKQVEDIETRKKVIGLGKRIHSLRLEKKMSIVALARASKVTVRLIKKLEKGTIPLDVVRVDFMTAIVHALDMDFDIQMRRKD